MFNTINNIISGMKPLGWILTALMFMAITAGVMVMTGAAVSFTAGMWGGAFILVSILVFLGVIRVVLGENGPITVGELILGINLLGLTILALYVGGAGIIHGYNHGDLPMEIFAAGIGFLGGIAFPVSFKIFVVAFLRFLVLFTRVMDHHREDFKKRIEDLTA